LLLLKASNSLSSAPLLLSPSLLPQLPEHLRAYLLKTLLKLAVLDLPLSNPAPLLSEIFKVSRSVMEPVLLSQLELDQRLTSKNTSYPKATFLTFHSPDTPQAFLDYPPFKAAAFSAPIPKGYALNFTNLHASTSTSSYMGYTTLNQYDTNKCASLCTSQTGCVAFNLYFERDPTLDPNAQNCPNPPSETNIKCVFWGVPVSSATATNSGQYRDSFQVVIAGTFPHHKPLLRNRH
jgi:hypothetical protein